MKWFPALGFPAGPCVPQHIGDTAPELPGARAMVPQSTSVSPRAGDPASSQTVPVSLFPDNTHSVGGHLWGRIQQYLSKEKEKKLMARKKLEEKFKEDIVLHVPIRLFFSLFHSTDKPQGPSNTHPHFEEEGQKRSNVAIFISSTIFIGFLSNF